MSIEGAHHVARMAAPTAAEFERRFLDTSTPVVLEGLLDAWPARRAWTLEALRARFGDRTVPAATTRAGMLEHDPRSGIVYSPIPFGALLDGLRADPPPARYVTFAIGEHLPELAGDIRPFPYERGALWTRRRMWIGPSGAASPMHQDLPENLYAQFVGRRRFYLFPPAESRRMYRHPLTSSLPNFGRVDAEAPDFERFPAFAGACGVVVELGPGDVLYLPSLWWHQARALEASVSMNLWWSSRLPLAVVLKLAETYKRVRGLSL